MENTLLKQPKISFSENTTNHYPEILTDEALLFLAALHEKFNAKRLELLRKRVKLQRFFDDGNFPEFTRFNVT